MIPAIREDGDETGGDYWLPIVDPGAVAPRLITRSCLTFVCRELVKAGTSIGFGALGMRRGKSAVGQVRFEWRSAQAEDPAPIAAVAGLRPVSRTNW
jgi:hypothetical protein